MTEETPAQEATPKPKQYIILIDDVAMAVLGKLMPSLKFCLVEGLAIPDNPHYHLLANPIIKKSEE